MPESRPFDRATLEAAFAYIGDRAVQAGKVVEITVYGGSALVLTLKTRPATRDVDAVFEADRGFVRHVAQEIAAENGWDESWLNDGAKGFLSRADQDPDSRRLFRSYPSEQAPGLRVFVAAPEYVFAMKCMAMRIGGVEESRDVQDIEALIHLLGLKSFDEAIALVEAFYPANQISPKTQFGLEALFGRLGGAPKDSP